MGPAPVGEDWQLVAVDLGVDHGVVGGKVHDILHGQDYGREYPWPFNLEGMGAFTEMRERHKSRVGLIKYN